MKNEPLISIIMPAYNSDKFIAQSIESVIAQTYPNWELIIIDDGSEDNTGTIAKHFAALDDRVKYIFQNNQRQAAARNNGIKNSTGELLAFLDSDDLWIPEKLEIQIEFLKNTKADLIFSNGYIFTKDKSQIKGDFSIISGYLQGDNAIKLFLFQNRIPILSVLSKRQVIEEVGCFESNENIVEDYHLWLKILMKNFVIYGLSDKLFYYRRHELQ